VLIFGIIGLVTAVGVTTIEAGEDQRERAVMRQVAQTVATALDRQGNTTEAYLRAGSALFASTTEISSSLFQRFASELRLDSDAHGSEAIGWAEIISVGRIDAFERSMSAVKSFEFRVRREPVAQNERLAPITFLKPDTEPNRQALGYDLYSNPASRAAMDEAASLVSPIATAKLHLSDDGAASGQGFLILMPVFEGAQGSRVLKGFIFSAFDAHYFLTSAMATSAHPQMGVRVYDGDASPENLLAQHSPAFPSGVVMAERLLIGSRAFLVEIESAKAGSLSPLSMATLLIGLALASLLLLLTRLLTRQALEDEASLVFFEEQNSIRNSLTRELNHRVKNTLASIISIISLTRHRTDDLDDFADGLEGRVRALSATHDLLTQSEWATTPVRSVVEVELAPYAGGGSDVELSGSSIELAPNDALSLGLAIHELATNAAKYGALSRPGGTVTISWEREGDELVVLNWAERGGPEVSKDRTPGFGTQLIQKIVAHELRQPVDLRFDPDGVSCTLRIPLRVRSAFQIRERLARLSD